MQIRQILNELRPGVRDGDYATVDDLLAAPDLIEQDIQIRRWTRGGAPLHLRIRALDLMQEGRIRRECLVKHPVSGEIVEDRVVFVEATIREGVIVPKLTAAQARELRTKNPRIVEALADYLWILSALDDDAIADAAHDLSGTADDDRTLPTTDDAAAATPE